MLPPEELGGGGSMEPADDKSGVGLLDAGLEPLCPPLPPPPPVLDRPIGGRPGPGPKLGDGIVNGYEPVPLRDPLEPFWLGPPLPPPGPGILNPEECGPP